MLIWIYNGSTINIKRDGYTVKKGEEWTTNYEDKENTVFNQASVISYEELVIMLVALFNIH